jgi:hypothetical protein
MQTSLSPATSTPIPLISGSDFNPSSLTAEGLLTYVTTRLQTLDTQIDEIFEKQQSSQKVRSSLSQISECLGKLDERKSKPTEGGSTANLNEIELANEIRQHIEDIRLTAPDVAERLTEELAGKNGILTQIEDPQNQKWDEDSATREEILDYRPPDEWGTPETKNSANYTGLAVTSGKEVVSNINSDLDATAQQDMIRLQSITGVRGTSVGLVTNLLAALSESFKSIVANVRA